MSAGCKPILRIAPLLALSPIHSSAPAAGTKSTTVQLQLSQPDVTRTSSMHSNLVLPWRTQYRKSTDSRSSATNKGLGLLRLASLKGFKQVS